MNILTLDKNGWPVEQFENRWFLNWIRRVLHGKSLVCSECWYRKMAVISETTPDIVKAAWKDLVKIV